MHKRRKFSLVERDFIEHRAQGCCEYCKMLHDFSPDTFQIEHIVALIKGGTNVLTNLAFSCGGCNNRKSVRIVALDPLSGVNVPLFNPRTDIWSNHFEWRADYSIVEGLSAVGRATVEQLKLNRKGLVNLRKALVVFGVHPV